MGIKRTQTFVSTTVLSLRVNMWYGLTGQEYHATQPLPDQLLPSSFMMCGLSDTPDIVLHRLGYTEAGKTIPALKYPHLKSHFTCPDNICENLLVPDFYKHGVKGI